MSLFLGSIHHWLYNKIFLFEDIDNKVIHTVKEQGIDILVNRINKQFGEPT